MIKMNYKAVMKPLIDLPDIISLYLSEQPLPIVGINAAKLVPLGVINQRLAAYRKNDFSWTENIYIPDQWALNDIDRMKLAEIAEKFIPLDALCVCYMTAEVGYGAFTRLPIKKGGILLYSGIIKPYNREKLYYGMGAGEQFVIDGQHMSGFADLFQDLYEPGLDTAPFNSDVAQNNFTAKTLSLSCGTITLLEAKHDIAPLTQCGVSYGALFWKMQDKLHGIKKIFFDKNGRQLV